ncbi:uncharacterized protein DFL_008255 [Arthrobotrys flagrans]|uniref:PHD-type domain-containing protein n=1 Tax=Arthrobotrys flagrans TaxID=97331 RepID=A0A436ZN75_ARTFL|nr:hypothetical protein DFL_008255 [Arthrobotrys flagrans]
MATTAAPTPRIKLHFSAGAYPPPPTEQDGGIDEDGDVMESEEPESSGDDDGDVDSEYPISPAAVNRRTEDFDASVLNAEPVLPFRPIRIILKAPKRNPEELEEVAATVSVRKKRKRRKSKTSHRRYDSSTSSEEYIQSGFKTLSGRTVVNPNTRKEPSPSPPPPKHAPPKKFKSKTMASTSSKSTGVSRKPANNQGEEEAIRLSILNARCVKCHKASEPKGDKIVFCDGCEKPYHQTCHRPKIDQSYIEVLEKNWFCFKCAKVPGEEEEDEDLFEEMEDYEEGEEADRRNELINQIQAEQEEDGAYLREVDTASEDHEDECQEKEGGGNDYYPAEQREQAESQPTTNFANPIESQNMEYSIKGLDDEQHKLFLETLSHDDLVDLICRLRSNGATFDFDFPSGIENKLVEFTRARNERNKGKKRKSSAAAAVEAAKDKESSQAEESVPSSAEEEDGPDGDHPPEPKRRKLTASQRYWLWREDPETPSITHIVYRNGVGRPAHEVYPPLFPYPGRGQPDVPQPEERDGGGEGGPKDDKQV